MKSKNSALSTHCLYSVWSLYFSSHQCIMKRISDLLGFVIFFHPDRKLIITAHMWITEVSVFDYFLQRNAVYCSNIVTIVLLDHWGPLDCICFCEVCNLYGLESCSLLFSQKLFRDSIYCLRVERAWGLRHSVLNKLRAAMCMFFLHRNSISADWQLKTGYWLCEKSYDIKQM